MNAATMPMYEHVDDEYGEDCVMPPYPIYVIEMEDFSEVQRIQAALAGILAEQSAEAYPELRDLLGKLQTITPGIMPQ